MSRRSVLVIIGAALIAGPVATASAAAQRTEYGPPQGVQATATGNTVEIRFTGAAAAFGKAHAGQPVAIACAPHPAPGLDFAGSGDAVSTTLDRIATARVAPDGASVRATLKHAPGDACDVIGNGDPRLPSSEYAHAALTPAGAAYLDEQALGTRMADLAHAAKPGAVYRTAAEVVALGGGGVAALDTPDATPPAGRIGYWSHGRAVSFVATSAAGRHLVLQDLGGGMLRSNVFEAVLRWTPAAGTALTEDASTGAGTDDGGETVSGGDDEGADLGPGDGVTGRVTGRTLVIRFSGAKAAKTYRDDLAGRRAGVQCLAVPRLALLGGRSTFKASRTTFVRVPRHGGAVRAAVPAGGHDVCAIGVGDRVAATVLLTKAGRGYIGGFVAMARLSLVGAFAAAGATSYPGAATIAAAQPELVPMDTPGQALTPGRLGVWTDANRRALLATPGADGRRYVLADEGEGLIRTNIYAPLLAILDSVLA